MAKCRKIHPNQEKGILIRSFVFLMVIQTVLVTVLCTITIRRLNTVNFNWFFPIDIITLLISVIFMSLILMVLGGASAISNAGFTWFFYHCFMFLFLIAELIIIWIASNVDAYLPVAGATWERALYDQRMEMQNDLSCCGFANTSDNPAEPCPSGAREGCSIPLHRFLYDIRNIASVSLFLQFVFSMFIDFVSFSICFHPDVVTIDDAIHEEESYINSQPNTDDPPKVSSAPLLKPLRSV
jgi:hypothetical protein